MVTSDESGLRQLRILPDAIQNDLNPRYTDGSSDSTHFRASCSPPCKSDGVNAIGKVNDGDVAAVWVRHGLLRVNFGIEIMCRTANLERPAAMRRTTPQTVGGHLLKG
jgi:hypothetical protein